MKYVFRKAVPGEERTVLSLIAERMRWMDEKGISQWNKEDYLNVYPLSYYQSVLPRMYVLAEEETGRVVCAAVLAESDRLWEDDLPALYVHHFVSKVGRKGVGVLFLQQAEQLALREGKQALRLDSEADNPPLTAYYDRLGFVPCGSCHVGVYNGMRRQKKLEDAE